MDWATVMSTDPTLETERLLLRKVRMEDINDVFEYASDPLVTRYVLFNTLVTLDDARTFIERRLAVGPERNIAGFAVALKENDKVIGTCNIHLEQERSFRAEVAYALNRTYWNQGYATEAVLAMLDFGFTRLGMNRIAALCKPENVASARVMEKAGMIYEGLLREYLFAKGEYWDVQVYSILRKDWNATR